MCIFPASSFSDVRIRQRAAPDVTDWTVDASVQAPTIEIASVQTNGSSLSLSWTASAGVAEAVYWKLSWTDTNGDDHVWLFDVPPPADGNGTLTLPGLPPGFGALIAHQQMESILEYRDLDYVPTYSDTRSLPEPMFHTERLSQSIVYGTYLGYPFIPK